MEIKNGKGLIKEYDYDNELIFESEYLNGEKNGKGKEYHDGKLIFKGEYYKDFRLKGKIYVNKKLEFEGEFLFDRKYDGKGYDEFGNIIY